MSSVYSALRPGMRLGLQHRSITAAFVLSACLVMLALVSLTHGAVSVPREQVLNILVQGAGSEDMERQTLVVLNIRLPRLILGMFVGSTLGVSGTLMQGLFRNPLADPGLVGVSGGAGVFAAAAIVLADRIPAGWLPASFALLPMAAFVGALASTSLLYLLATRDGRTSIATMLLAGVALAALAGSVTGLLAYVSDDRQLRDLTFWSMGSLGGATWTKVWLMAPIAMLLFAAGPFLSRRLNALALGEAEAFHLGINIQRLKLAIIALVSLSVGVSVAACGVISFVGIVAPHMLRLVLGPDHRALLPLSALAGAILLSGADLLARTLVAPAELPIGILTAAIGAPFFLWLLMRRLPG